MQVKAATREMEKAQKKVDDTVATIESMWLAAARKFDIGTEVKVCGTRHCYCVCETRHCYCVCGIVVGVLMQLSNAWVCTGRVHYSYGCSACTTAHVHTATYSHCTASNSRAIFCDVGYYEKSDGGSVDAVEERH